ncbi:MAG: hypothetical protein ACRDZ2_16785 [Ilumatobacteraceae bacterium]
MKQSGPGAFDLGLGDRSRQGGTATQDDEDADEYAALAQKYGVEFDDDEAETPADD